MLRKESPFSLCFLFFTAVTLTSSPPGTRLDFLALQLSLTVSGGGGVALLLAPSFSSPYHFSTWFSVNLSFVPWIQVPACDEGESWCISAVCSQSCLFPQATAADNAWPGPSCLSAPPHPSGKVPAATSFLSGVALDTGPSPA